ncbi:MAG: hypothetical protein KKG09_02255 [Verrucomicrobia bacterium]|nr:hypothetical protein [Verrucomicrobiota bacterium]MCG2681735.1 hypothetical protein [Kiritimatiellia bacterium]MBU4247657.1 hypothetical protein [Verrucomicrobiota bacterium]MBU4290478.1 hypothetical protein [Verrucomicrobiota bacterium]MBU4428202.1 hypothetical protein [Verrucomicrobiota bacterium]
MIKRFFHGLMENKVEFLLISGQAAILYGAATFSEDIDLWIKPTAGNCRRRLHQGALMREGERVK